MCVYFNSLTRILENPENPSQITTTSNIIHTVGWTLTTDMKRKKNYLETRTWCSFVEIGRRLFQAVGNFFLLHRCFGGFNCTFVICNFCICVIICNLKKFK